MKGMDLLEFCFGDSIVEQGTFKVTFDFGNGYTAEALDVCDELIYTLYFNEVRKKKEVWYSLQKDYGYDLIALDMRAWHRLGKIERERDERN